MKERNPLRRTISLGLSLLFLLACGITGPVSGIDEPVVVENVTVKDTFGHTWTGDIKLRFLDAYTEDSRESQSGTVYPRDSNNTFLTLEFELDGPSGSLDWIGHNATLTCGEDEREVDIVGAEFNEGILEAWNLVFEVPQDSDFKQCQFNLEEHTVELTTLFD
jgi:hypothetical protein